MRRWIGLIAAVGLGGAIAFAATNAAKDPLTGRSGAVADELARLILREAPLRGLILIGEDHRSPVPDAIGAALVQRGELDCLFLELHEDLQPALDHYASGASWARTVKPAIRRFFKVEPLALGQDRQTVRGARKKHLGLYAVDAYPREILHRVRSQASYGQAVAPNLRRQLIDDRDDAMADRIERLHADGVCERSLFTVGWNHLPGLLRRLSEKGIPVWRTTVFHREPPPLPKRLTVEWGDGRILVR